MRSKARSSSLSRELLQKWQSAVPKTAQTHCHKAALYAAVELPSSKKVVSFQTHKENAKSSLNYSAPSIKSLTLLQIITTIQNIRSK